MEKKQIIHISEHEIMNAASEGIDAFISLFTTHYLEAIGGELNAEGMNMLNSDQITLLGYIMFRDEIMDGGFVQLIHNGYGPFFFENPFAKAMRLMGAHDFSKLIYKARELYMKNKDEIARECSDNEFMALFEQFPEFDDLDDEFIENEEEITETIARYVDEHIELFASIVKE